MGGETLPCSSWTPLCSTTGSPAMTIHYGTGPSWCLSSVCQHLRCSPVDLWTLPLFPLPESLSDIQPSLLGMQLKILPREGKTSMSIAVLLPFEFSLVLFGFVLGVVFWFLRGFCCPFAVADVEELSCSCSTLGWLCPCGCFRHLSHLSAVPFDHEVNLQHLLVVLLPLAPVSVSLHGRGQLNTVTV